MQKNGHLIINFVQRSTSDDWLSTPSDKSCLQCKKMAAKSSKSEMLIFGLCSTSDDWPSNLNDKSHPKCKKMATKLSKTEMLIFRLRSTSDD